MQCPFGIDYTKVGRSVFRTQRALAFGVNMESYMNGWVRTRQKSLESVHRLQCTFLACNHYSFSFESLLCVFHESISVAVVDSSVRIVSRHGAIVSSLLLACHSTSDFSPTYLLSSRATSLGDRETGLTSGRPSGCDSRPDHADPLLPRNTVRNDARLQASAQIRMSYRRIHILPLTNYLPWKACE